MRRAGLYCLLFFFAFLILGISASVSTIIYCDSTYAIVLDSEDQADSYTFTGKFPINNNHLYRRSAQNHVFMSNKAIDLPYLSHPINHRSIIVDRIKSYFSYAEIIIVGLPISDLIYPFNGFW